MTATREPQVRVRGGPLEALGRPIRRRGDIEGLRAVAVLLVLADHAGLPLTGGYVGVDVFFVISGFLITSLLVTELVEHRRISLRAFYARRARRLLPGAAGVLVVTGALTVLLLPRTRWLDTAYDIGASAIYVQNWRLAGLAVDYQAQDTAVSPLQHFWSLAVEEQFYLLWPLLLVLVAVLVRSGRLGRAPRGSLDFAGPALQRRVVGVLALVMVLVAVPSFVWSVHDTAVNPSGAYFVTTTRLWELAAGGAVVLLGRLPLALPAPIRAVLGWAGLTTILASAAAYTASTPFPGTAALVPVLGTAAVLAAGQDRVRGGAGSVLDVRPMRWIGKLSYSLYLWHWPLVVLVAAVAGERSMVLGTLAVTLSVVPAYLSFRYLEDPVRRSVPLVRDPEKSLAVGVACSAAAMAVTAALVIGVGATPVVAAPLPATLDASGNPSADTPRTGALVLRDDPRDDPSGAPTDSVPTITPDPLTVKGDFGYGFCSTPITSTEIQSCALGDLSSPVEVALIGDSHAQQWTTPLDLVAQQRHWRLTGYTKSTCPFLTQDVAFTPDVAGGRPVSRAYTECAAWRDRLLDRLTTAPNPPRMVIVSSGQHVPVSKGELVGGPQGDDLLIRGFRDAWSRLQARGIRVVVLADTPAPGLEIPDCAAANRTSLTRCTFSREESNSADRSALVAAARAQPDVTLIDLSDALCPTERCAPVIGGVMVWRDASHVSATYAATLAPRLARLLPALR